MYVTFKPFDSKRQLDRCAASSQRRRDPFRAPSKPDTQVLNGLDIHTSYITYQAVATSKPIVCDGSKSQQSVILFTNAPGKYSRSVVVERYASLYKNDYEAVFCNAFYCLWHYRLAWVFPLWLIPRVLTHMN